MMLHKKQFISVVPGSFFSFLKEWRWLHLKSFQITGMEAGSSGQKITAEEKVIEA